MNPAVQPSGLCVVVWLQLFCSMVNYKCHSLVQCSCLSHYKGSNVPPHTYFKFIKHCFSKPTHIYICTVIYILPSTKARSTSLSTFFSLLTTAAGNKLKGCSAIKKALVRSEEPLLKKKKLILKNALFCLFFKEGINAEPG